MYYGKQEPTNSICDKLHKNITNSIYIHSLINKTWKTFHGN